MLPQQVWLREVGPRDGLQNEKQFVATKDKITLIELLSETGLSYIESTAFVHPKWIPALQDADDVMAQLVRKPGITYAALTPNERGLLRAKKGNMQEVAVFMSASESHNKSNVNATIAESLQIIEQLTRQALADNIKVRGYISVVFGCPFEGDVAKEAVLHIAQKMIACGVTEISLGDTIGVATPNQVKALLAYLQQHIDLQMIALHFHDTYGRALANIYAGLEMGITKYDSAISGLGGCPYAPGASGNVSTEDVNAMLQSMNIATGVDQQKLYQASAFLQQILNKPTISHSYQAEHNI